MRSKFVSGSFANASRPVQVGSKEIRTGKQYSYYDRSQEDRVCVYRASLSDADHMKDIVDIARNDMSWSGKSMEERNRILHRTADNLSAGRGDLIGCMAAVTGKTFMEGDVEVSEAIDFCRFYPFTMSNFEKMDTVSYQPKGVILVISPWNFPLAIPVGGVSAALSGGNTVILKPATVAFPIAWQFAKCFWDAGVPRETLQVICCDGREPLNYLTTHPAVKHVILTGGTETAFSLLENNPRCPLSAETGGKNTMILTGSGDQDHAIMNIVHSAFGNAGQKCSACSLLMLEKEIYHSPEFRNKLTDAVKSMQTGSVWEFNNIIGPMITNRNDKLIHAIEHLEEGESWLVKPEYTDKQKYMLKPCVKWGVRPGSYTFENELFAPLLGVVCIDDLKQGIRYVNSSEYGLTSGLQSLDEDEQELWKNSIEAGNLYINRGITGAIVNRQPFGGMKRSAFGGGIKAGGPNYVSCFVSFTENRNRQDYQPDHEFGLFSSLLQGEDIQRFNQDINSYRTNWKNEFSQERDVNHIIGEENIFRYRPLRNMALRVDPADKLCDVLMIAGAAGIAGIPLDISISGDVPFQDQLKTVTGKTGGKLIIQDESAFLSVIDQYERIRTCTENLSEAFYQKAARLGKHVATSKPLAEGRIELLNYLKEQSISYEYHRYGSIIDRETGN